MLESTEHIKCCSVDITTSSGWRCADDGQGHGSTIRFAYSLRNTIRRGSIRT